MSDESEYQTRKRRIDTRLKKQGWEIIPYRSSSDTSSLSAHAVEEYPTSSGPADYALFVGGQLLGFIEAKRVTISTINALEQAKRYSKTVETGPGNWDGYRVPFLFSSNGELVYFLDVRNAQNISRKVADFYTPEALQELFTRNFRDAEHWLNSHPIDNPRLRPYQANAIAAIEQGIIDGKRKMMVAMATGTGKTFMAVSAIYRLLETKKFKRILFLVDRKALAAQAATAFAAFETPHGNKLSQEYEVYSQRFQKEDLEEDEKFDVSVLPNDYLTNPDAGKTFVYVCTIQRMAINLLGSDAVFRGHEDDDRETEEGEQIDIPVHVFDLVIADECHRGYTSQDDNVWRTVLEYFDAVKIGLTATPAAHTTAWFGSPVFRYGVEQAILDGYLVDYNAISINSNVKMNGLFLQEGEQVSKVDTETGKRSIEGLEDERAFDASEVERKITAPQSNKMILEEIAKYAFEFEKEKGRFPKTLIFAVNDKNHASHADLLVTLAKEVFNRGDDFVVKITGNSNVDRPLQKIRRFRNRPEPKVVVTVDMLSTGVDIPSLEYIVFLRPVKSRILWEQMLGRGTRRCDEINKDAFTVFDCFDGTLIAYFKDASNFKMEAPGSPTLPIAEIIRRIDNNEDRAHYVQVLVKRLRRIERTMGREARDQFAAYITDGDVGRFADRLPGLVRNDFPATMKLLNAAPFQKLLVHYKRPQSVFLVAEEAGDYVSSETVFNVGDQLLKPGDYLDAFASFVKTHRDDIEAMRIVLEKPQQWNTTVLKELRALLVNNHFAEKELQKAHRLVYHKGLVDIISMIKHAAATDEPLLEIHERIDKAIQHVFGNSPLSEPQQEWIRYIKNHLVENLTIEEEDFGTIPIFEKHGGLGRFKKIFTGNYRELIRALNEAVAA